MKRLMTGFAVAALMVAVAQPQAAGAREPDQVCGIEPGQGLFNYVKVWDMSCRKARQISRKAERKFCSGSDVCDVDRGDFILGEVRVRGWDVKLKLGYESYRARSEKNGKRFIHKAAA